jgi:hypothetical protein
MCARFEVTRMLVQHCSSSAGTASATPQSLSVQGHAFELSTTELAGSYCVNCAGLVWMLEPRYSCTVCGLHAHATCAAHTAAACTGRPAGTPQPSPNGLFGTPVADMVTAPAPAPAPSEATPAAAGSKTSRPRPPLFLESCIRRVEELGVRELNLYRRSTEPSRLHAIQAGGSKTDMEFLRSEDTRTLTAVVKTWLRELPEPLLTHDAFDALIDAVDIPNDGKRIGALHRILTTRLPPINLAAFELLVTHLAWVVRRAADLKIETYTIALIFGPSVLRPPPGRPPQLLKAAAVLDCFIRQHVKKIESTWADIQALAVACNTLHRADTASAAAVPPEVVAAEREISALFAFLSISGGGGSGGGSNSSLNTSHSSNSSGAGGTPGVDPLLDSKLSYAPRFRNKKKKKKSKAKQRKAKLIIIFKIICKSFRF